MSRSDNKNTFLLDALGITTFDFVNQSYWSNDVPSGVANDNAYNLFNGCTAAFDQIGINGVPNTASLMTDPNNAGTASYSAVVIAAPALGDVVTFRTFIRKKTTSSPTCGIILTTFAGSLGAAWHFDLRSGEIRTQPHSEPGDYDSAQLSVIDGRRIGHPDWWVVLLTFEEADPTANFQFIYPAYAADISSPVTDITQVGDIVHGQIESYWNTVNEVMNLPVVFTVGGSGPVSIPGYGDTDDLETAWLQSVLVNGGETIYTQEQPWSNDVPSSAGVWWILENSLTAALDAVGVNGEANAASTITDPSITANSRLIYGSIPGVAGEPISVRIFVAKDPSVDVFSGLTLYDGAQFDQWAFGVAKGEAWLIDKAISNYTSFEVLDGAKYGHADWWIVTCQFTGLGPSAFFYLYPSIFSEAGQTGSYDETLTGSIVMGQGEYYMNTTVGAVVNLPVIYTIDNVPPVVIPVPNNDVNDLYMQMFIEAGVISREFNTAAYEWLKLQGVIPGALPEMWNDYWLGNTGSGDAVIDVFNMRVGTLPGFVTGFSLDIGPGVGEISPSSKEGFLITNLNVSPAPVIDFEIRFRGDYPHPDQTTPWLPCDTMTLEYTANGTPYSTVCPVITNNADGGYGWYIQPLLEIAFDDLATEAGNTIPVVMRNTIPVPTTVGAEMVTNGGFDTDTDWTKGTGWTIAGGIATSDGSFASPGLQQALAVTEGLWYRVEMDVLPGATFREGDGLRVFVGADAGAGCAVVLREGFHSFDLVCAGGVAQIMVRTFAGNDFTGSIDNLSVKPLT